jgi:predicted CxxxxCH...CXXCH cytochrome family protein
MRRIATAALLALGLASCGGAPPPTEGATAAEGVLGKYYYVKVSTPVNGVVDSLDGRIHCVAGVACAAVKYSWAEVVTLRATPNAGFAFQNWAGDCSGTTCVLTTAAGHFADFTVVAVFNTASLVGHGNFTDTGVHAAAFFQFLANTPSAPRCNVCHGASYAGQGIAPSCNGCHQAAGWANWQQSCSFCHGTKNATTMAGYDVALHPEWAAPPDDIAFRLNGVSDGAAGAHQKHVNPGVANAVRAPIACAECHVVPATAIHTLNLVLDIPFGALSHSQGASPTWAPATLTCGTNYCHGSFSYRSVRGTNSSLPWTGTLTGCTTCHAMPPAGHGYGGTSDPASCAACHPDTVLPSGAIDLAKGKHINGLADASGACNSCHGFPPATGAHLAHFGAAGASSGYGDTQILEDKFPAATPTTAPSGYAFGCGLCHGSDFANNHNKGSVDVLLSSTGAPAGTLLARNAAGAAYDGVAKTCSGVYCHSSGQATPAFVTTPGWFSGTTLGCGGCHANPPKYANGGTASATANSHIGLADDGYEYGHYMGVTGPFHGPFHGGFYTGEDSSPMTCQTCHANTVDPAATGPSGFYWLDTTGDYRFPGAVDPGYQDALQCLSCHGSVAGATVKAGAVLPLRHVNGKRDVVFDQRTTIPAFSFLPGGTNRPTKPYWTTTTGGLSATLPGYVTFAGTTVQFDLTSASYNPATKTCSSVGCHLEQTSVVWGTPYVYYSMEGTCFTCHPYNY